MSIINEDELKRIAEEARIKAMEKSVDDVRVEVPSTAIPDDNDDMVIMTGETIPTVENDSEEDMEDENVPTEEEPAEAPKKKVKNKKVVDSVFTDKVEDTIDDEMTASILGGSITPSKITEDDLRAVMPDIPPEMFKTKAAEIMTELDEHNKRLIIDLGMTPEEAMTSTKHRMNALAAQVETDYLAKNPKLGIIEVNKKDAENLQLTEEEHAKLTTTKSIKLVVIEDQDLMHIKMDKVDTKHKAEYINSVDDALSKYGTLIPIMGDFCEFKGAQIIQLAKAIQYRDEPMESIVSKKAALLYDRLIGGAYLRKYDELRKVILPYADFANQYLYQDIDLGLYAILVASSMDTTQMEMTCDSCSNKWSHDYNVSSILKLDGMSDEFKTHCDQVLTNRSNPEALKELHDTMNKTRRYKSPYTQNIYDINFPSIAKAVNLMKKIDQEDEVIVYCSALAIYLTKMYVYNKNTEGYIAIEDYEVDLMLEALQRVPDEDFKIILAEINAHMYYEPEFVIDAQCPRCGQKHGKKVSVQDLIFHRALGSSTEIN